MRKSNIKKVSVIIPTWNGEKTIKACIKSVLSQTLKPYEIIIVDNASTDGTAKEVSKVKSKLINLIENKKNLGAAGGRNTGLKKVSEKSDYAFLFDHDMVADKNMLAELVKTSQKFNSDLVTPKIYYLKPKNLIWAAGTDVNLWTGQVLFRGGKDTGQFDEEVEVGVAPAAMLISRKILNKEIKFDQEIFAVWEDTDFSFKVKKKGFKIFYSPEAVAYHDLEHDPKAEAERLLTRYAYCVGRNRIIFMKRYAKSYLIFLMFLPIYLFYYLKLALEYKKPTGYTKFLKGTLDGLTH